MKLESSFIWNNCVFICTLTNPSSNCTSPFTNVNIFIYIYNYNSTYRFRKKSMFNPLKTIYSAHCTHYLNFGTIFAGAVLFQISSCLTTYSQTLHCCSRRYRICDSTLELQVKTHQVKFEGTITSQGKESKACHKSLKNELRVGNPNCCRCVTSKFTIIMLSVGFLKWAKHFHSFKYEKLR